jgi:hypothetical protein
MRHLIPTIMLGLVLTACADNAAESSAAGIARVAVVPQVDTMQQPLVHVQPTVKRTDTLLISEKAAIFITPDSLRIEKLKQEGSEEDFNVTANDYLYYMGTAQEFLDSVKVRVVDVENEKFIKFVGSNKKRQLITISKQLEPWSIYFFDPAKKAKQVDMTAIEEEYKDYFK